LLAAQIYFSSGKVRDYLIHQLRRRHEREESWTAKSLSHDLSAGLGLRNRDHALSLGQTLEKLNLTLLGEAMEG
jgi:hypothetical protein